VAYNTGTAGVLTTANYKKSINDMSSWGNSVQFNTTTGDNRFVYVNTLSNERVYGVFYNNSATNDGLYGDTLADISAADLTWSTGGANFKIYQSSSLVWGSGTEVCSGTLSDDNAATITCSGTGLNNSTQYRVDVTLKNAGGTTVKMNGASDFVDHVAVMTGWAGTSPTLGSCGFNDFGSDNGSTSCTSAFSGNNVRITNTGAGNVNLQAGESEGFMYVITTGNDVPDTHSINYMNSTLDSISEDSSKITLTKTAVISISIADGTVNYGTVAANTSKDTSSGELNDTQMVTNESNTAIDINIRGQDTACPWTLSGTSGSNAYTHSFCNSGTGSPDLCDANPVWTMLTTSNQTLSTNIAVSGTHRFDLRLHTPTSTSCFTQQSADVTVQAVQH
jgi:hypothetical protein